MLIRHKSQTKQKLNSLTTTITFYDYCTIMCGADNNTVTVAIIVNSVKTIKHNLKLERKRKENLCEIVFRFMEEEGSQMVNCRFLWRV